MTEALILDKRHGMSLESRKLELVESILRLSSIEVIESIQSLIDERDAGVVAYTIDGHPLDQHAYKAQIKQAEKDKYLSHDDVRKAAEQW